MDNPVAKHFSEQFEWMIEWVNVPLKALSDDDLRQSAIENGNTGIWLLGHLVISDDDFSLYMGKGGLFFPEYIPLFGSGTKPLHHNNYPAVAEIKSAWSKVCEKNRRIYSELTDEELKEPHALINEEGKDFVKTKSETASTWQMHQVYHAGQLSVLYNKIKLQNQHK